MELINCTGMDVTIERHGSGKVYPAKRLHSAVDAYKLVYIVGVTNFFTVEPQNLPAHDRGEYLIVTPECYIAHPERADLVLPVMPHRHPDGSITYAGFTAPRMAPTFN